MNLPLEGLSPQRLRLPIQILWEESAEARDAIAERGRREADVATDQIRDGIDRTREGLDEAVDVIREDLLPLAERARDIAPYFLPPGPLIRRLWELYRNRDPDERGTSGELAQGERGLTMGVWGNDSHLSPAIAGSAHSI